MFTHLPLLVEEFLKEILFKKKWYILKEIFQEEIQSNASIHVTDILYMSYGAIILNLFPSLFENLMNNMNYFPRKKHTYMEVQSLCHKVPEVKAGVILPKQ